MWQEVFIALCLVFVIEGLLPFISPRQWKQALAMLARMEDRKIRMMGLASMLFGTALLYLVR